MFSDQELNQKLALLDARDKRLRQQMTKQTELSKARAYIGSCEDMCPERERCLRLGFQLSIFERDRQNQPDEYAMVKEYRRAGADQEEPLPHDLRTPKALQTTVDYIVCNLMDDPRSKSSELTLEWYDFLWDRLRAIRKDITQQNICDQEAAILVERCTRFHVHSCYALNRIKDFDVDMNKRNLNDCLQMLRQIYNDLRNLGIVCPGELEFQKYDILLHLDEDHLSTNVLMKTSEHRLSEDMKFITQIYNAHTNNDYYKFFQLLERADYMTSCILGLYVNKMRLIGMKIIVAAFNSKQAIWYPAEMAINSLGFDDLDDLRAFAASLEIEVLEKNSKHYLLLNRELIVSIRNSSLSPVKSTRLIESKMCGLSVGQLVYGNRTLPPNPYKQTPLTTSEPDIITQDFEIQYTEAVDDSDCHIQAEDQMDEVGPEPTDLRIDPQISCSIAPTREPIFTKIEMAPMDVDETLERHIEHEGLPDRRQQKLKIIDFQPRDESVYTLKATNPAVTAEFAPIKVEPNTTAPLESKEYAPEVLSITEEVVAGPGSHPEMEVMIKASPDAGIDWFNESLPLSDRQQSDVHPETTQERALALGPDETEHVGKVDEIAERQLKIARDMPAGRFKRCRLTIPERVSAPNTFKKISPQTRKSICQTDQMESMKESIKDEKKANENLFNLLRMFL